MKITSDYVFVDLTQEFYFSMPVFPGDTEPTLVQTSEFKRDGFSDHALSTGMHVGTHVDAPFHFLETGKKISHLPLDRFCGRGVVVNALGKSIVDSDVLHNLEIREGDVVLLYTGHAKNFGSDYYFTQSPKLTLSLVQELVHKKIKMVGLDFPSPDQAPFELHRLLLGNEILILENLCNLEKMLGMDYFEVTAFPLKLPTGGALTRCVARILN